MPLEEDLIYTGHMLDMTRGELMPSNQKAAKTMTPMTFFA